MSEKQTLQVTSKRVKGFQVKNEIRDFEVTVDEPEGLGGTDTGPNPLEMILVALGSCVSIVATMVADEMAIDLRDVEVNVEGDFDVRGLKGEEGVRPGFSEVRASVNFVGDVSKEESEKLLKQVEKLCPVDDSLADPVDVKLNVA